MIHLYKKNGLLFAILWIVIYVISLSLADQFSASLGLQKSITAVVCALLTVILVLWMKNNNLFAEYGLCKPTIPARQLIYYIPLLAMASVNLWFGVTWNLSVPETICYIISMLFVGFLEEIIFRGLLFKEMCKDNVKTAILVSSVTFGIGHIVNLFNGSGADLFSNLLQVAYAIAGGFLFTILFYYSKSLWACIATHSILNALSVFAHESAKTPVMEILSAVALILISVLYAGYTIKRHGKIEKTSL